MEENKEISALFHLIDDPDEEVFTRVSDRIFSFGKEIIPNLESLWENTPAEVVQERIESLIHRLHYSELHDDFQEWNRKEYQDLIEGALMVSRFKYPDLHTSPLTQEIEKFRR